MTVLEYVFPPTYLEVKDRERLPRALVEAVAEAEKIAVGFDLIALGEAGGVEGRCGEFAVLQSDRGGREEGGRRDKTGRGGAGRGEKGDDLTFVSTHLYAFGFSTTRGHIDNSDNSDNTHYKHIRCCSTHRPINSSLSLSLPSVFLLPFSCPPLT